MQRLQPDKTENVIIHLNMAQPLLFNQCVELEDQHLKIVPHIKKHQLSTVTQIQMVTSTSQTRLAVPASHHSPKETGPSALLGGMSGNQTKAFPCSSCFTLDMFLYQEITRVTQSSFVCLTPHTQ